MATSPIYNWPEPDNTDLVKNGALAIRTLGNAIDTTMATMVPKTIVDAKGDLIAGTAADTTSRLAVGNNGETLVADSSTSTGLRYTAGTVQANPVLNSAMQVWQRGTSIAVGPTSNTYTADRWTCLSATGNFTVSRQLTGDTTNLPFIQYALRHQRNSGQTSTTPTYLTQSMESINSIPFVGKTVTFSFYARRGANFSGGSNTLGVNLESGTGTDQNINQGFTGTGVVVAQAATLTTTWQRFSYTGTVSSSANQLGFYFYYTPSGTAGANDWFEVTGVQIDIGSVALPFRTNGGTIQGELAACQRYYYRLGTGNGQPLGLCEGESTNIPLAVAVLPITMRTAPTLDQSTGTNYYLVRTAGANNNFSSFVLESSSTTAAVFYTSATIVSGAGGRFTTNNASAYVGFSAEL